MLQRNLMIWLAALLCAFTVPVWGFGATFEMNGSQIIEQKPQSPHQQTYIVRSGDTLWNLAKQLGTSVQTLMAQNHITDPHLLQIGQQISFSAWGSAPSPENAESVHHQTLSSRGVSLNGIPIARVLHCTLTAYTDGAESTGKQPGDPGYGLTSTGKEAIQGVTVAVDPNVIPYGTKLYIPGLGYRIAEDTGGAIVGDHIDIFYNSVTTARDFGVKYDRPVYILPDWYHIPID